MAFDKISRSARVYVCVYSLVRREFVFRSNQLSTHGDNFTEKITMRFEEVSYLITLLVF